MKRVILFARCSTMQQHLESQIVELQNEASRCGYSSNQQVLIQMKESAVTLDTEERQGIRMLKEAIETDSSIDSVIIFEISRLSRRPKVLYEVRDWLLERHINLICLKPYMQLLDNDGTMSQTANLLFSLFGSMAESEGYIRKERMHRGKKAKRAAGGYIGGTPLYGYMVDEDSKVVPDPELVPIIKRVYELYQEGGSFVSIGQWMIDNGICSKTLETATRRVSTILSRPEYAGICPEDSYPYKAIVSVEEYNKVKRLRWDKNREHTRLKYTSLCKGILYSKSGHMLSPNIRKHQYKLYLIDKTENMTIHFKLIDPFIWDKVLIQAKKQSKVTLKERYKKIDRENQEAEEAAKRYDKLIEDVNKQIERVEKRIIEGKMNESRGDSMIAELNKKIEEYEKEHYRVMQNHLSTSLELNFLSSGIKLTNKYNSLDDKEKNLLVKQFINKIVFEKTLEKRGHYRMTIEYKYDNPEQYYIWSSGPWNNIEKI